MRWLLGCPSRWRGRSIPVVLRPKKVLRVGPCLPSSPAMRRLAFSNSAVPVLLSVGALGLVVAAGSCGSADGVVPGAAGTICNVPGCADASSDVPLDQVESDVTRPDVVSATGGAGMAYLCGDGCVVAEEVHYPEDPLACEGFDGASHGGTAGAPSVWGCTVVRAEDGQPESQCVPAGTVLAGDPCSRLTRCAPGHACVQDDDISQCLPYCCSEPEACPAGTFCAKRSVLLPEGENEVMDVPVCVPAHDCQLDEPYPCPDGTTCRCPTGTACTVVRADGTTGCVTPGVGVEGDSCPCAPATESSLGYVCSQATATCVKLCLVGVSASGCSPGSHCQATAALPSQFGVCTASAAPGEGTEP